MNTLYEPILDIYDWNKQAGLLDKGYSDELESSMLVEEALEGMCSLETLGERVFCKSNTPKDISRSIVHYANGGDAFDMDSVDPEIPDVDRFDKHLDSIFINFGSLYKLGLTPEQVMHGLAAVVEANQSKLDAGQDDSGKQLKPTDFTGPEPKLQLILDERQ